MMLKLLLKKQLKYFKFIFMTPKRTRPVPELQQSCILFGSFCLFLDFWVESLHFSQ